MEHVQVEELSKQEIFNNVLWHILKQGRGSIDSDGRCLYRGPNGTSCAVGCLLTDEECEHPLLKSTVDVVKVYQEGLLPSRFKGHVGFLMDLQRVHDIKLSSGIVDMGNWESSMKAIAAHNNLVWAPLPITEEA